MTKEVLIVANLFPEKFIVKVNFSQSFVFVEAVVTSSDIVGIKWEVKFNFCYFLNIRSCDNSLIVRNCFERLHENNFITR